MQALQCVGNNDLMIVQFHYSQQGQEDRENNKVPDQLSRYSICHNLLFETSLSSFSVKQERQHPVFFTMLPQSKKYQSSTLFHTSFLHGKRICLYGFYSCTCVL